MIFSPFGFRNQVTGGVAPTPTPTPTPTPAPSIPTSGLTLYLDAANTSSYPGTGDQWYDLSGNNNTGIMGFGTYWDGADGGAMVFDGVDDQVVSQGNWVNIPEFNSSYTYVVFFNPTTALRNNGLMQIGASNTSRQRSSVRTLGPEFGSSGFSNDWNGTSYSRNTALSNNTWYQYAVTYDNTTITRQGYKNGSSSGITSLTSIGSLNVIDANTSAIGSSKNSTTNYWMLGKISIVLVYNRVLSSTEISDIWDAFKGRYGY